MILQFILKWIGVTSIKALAGWAIGKYVVAPVANWLASIMQKLVDDPTTDLDEKAVEGNRKLAIHFANKKLKTYF